MLGDLKQKLILTRAEGAYAFADLSLERQQPAEAARQYADQARDLRRRGLSVSLQAKGWAGVLRACAAFTSRQSLPVVLGEALEALSHLTITDLPGGWIPYENSRPLLIRLLDTNPRQAQSLGACLARLLPRDPRPRYAQGRALELLAYQARGEQAQSLAQSALRAYEEAGAASARVGAQRTWSRPLALRKAALLLRLLARTQSDAQGRACALLEDIAPGHLRSLAPEDQLVVVQAWLHSSRAMQRLRALDLLEALLGDESCAHAAISLLLRYMARLDWSYYGTEQDRVRGLLAQASKLPGASRVRGFDAWLTLLGELHDEVGRDAVPTLNHLVRLREHAVAHEGLGWAGAYYRVAEVLAVAPVETWRDILGKALHEEGAVPTALRPSWSRDSLAWALGALCVRVAPERGMALELLDAMRAPHFDTPHVQAAVSLLVPVLLSHWEQWPEVQPEAALCLSRFVRVASLNKASLLRLAQGFASAGLLELCGEVVRRAQSLGASPTDVAPFLFVLAQGELAQHKPSEAVRWLLHASWSEDAKG